MSLKTEKFSAQSLIIKCERTEEAPNFSNSSEYDVLDDGCYTRPKTTICSENEYLAEGNVPMFESIIVKEEPKLNVCTDSASAYTLDTTRNSSPERTNKLVKNLECYICKLVPSSTDDLRRHIQNHVDKFYFRCDQCGRNFSKRYLLLSHKTTHSGELPYACDECDRKFGHSSTLYKHKQTHFEYNERQFVCYLCDRRCSRKATLDRHLKTHIGEKSFVCDVCDKRFARNSTLNHHKLLHTVISFI